MTEHKVDPNRAIAPVRMPGACVPTVKDHFIKMLVYGKPGAGKTTLAASAEGVPEMKDVIVLNIEGGTLSLTNLRHIGISTLPEVRKVTKFSQLMKLIEWLATENHPYKTVVLDSLSEVQRLNIDGIVERETTRPTKGTKARENLDDVAWQDYGTSAREMRRALSQLRDLPMHVILPCATKVFEDENKRECYTADLTPALRSPAYAIVDVVGFMFIQEFVDEDKQKRRVRRMVVQPSFRYDGCKDRTPGERLGGVVDFEEGVPPMARIMSLMWGDTTK